MASSQKTDHLGLNKWNGTDIPKRADWNNDNQKIDSFYHQLQQTIGGHVAEASAHVSQSEKAKWNEGKTFSIQSYVGSGVGSRTITLGQKMSFGILFATKKPFSMMQPHLSSYGGVLSSMGCSDGLGITNNGFTVLQQVGADPSGNAITLNENGTTYVCVYWV